MHAANKLTNVRRRAARARRFPVNTCPASRHLFLMAQHAASGRKLYELDEDPEGVARTMFSVLESLWKARTELAKLKGKQ